MNTYTVTAKRWAKGWELHVDGVGVTQVRKLNNAEAMARDYISSLLEVPAGSFHVVVEPAIGDGLDAAVSAARSALRAAEDAQRNAARQSRDVVAKLKEKHLSGAEVAAILGVSPQRVSQLGRGSGVRASSPVRPGAGGSIAASARTGIAQPRGNRASAGEPSAKRSASGKRGQRRAAS